MKHKISCSISFDSNKEAEIVLKSIKPEMINTERAKTKMHAGGKELKIKIEAEDVNALHAAVSSFLRLIKTVK